MNELQLKASNPNHSVWVSASAGTGKTKILTDRVLRLLIDNVEFKKILCLTFTNAASGEMQNRINSTLASFAKIDESSLNNQLYQLLGRYPTATEIKKAKILYKKLLNSDDKINIYTIHSYCQKILKSFPLEAGINPAFQILDEISAKEVIAKVRLQLFLDDDNSEIINFFIKNCHETVLDEILDQIISQKLKFRHAQACLEPGNILLNSFHGQKVHDDIMRPAKDDKFVWPDPKLKARFLTKEGNKRKNLGRNCTPEILEHQDLIYRLDQQEKLQSTIEYSQHLVKLASIFLTYYEEHKFKHSLLDYDDLIYYAHQLLTSNAAKDWVLYKLDGGIDHLLVDEAQDTSKEQWQIIEAIIAEFYSGEGAGTQKRTIFVVGDEKQSIFSFQGADLNSFSAMNSLLKEKLLNAKRDFHVINLESSYRSTEEILDAVHNIFEHIKSAHPELFTISNIKISPHRKHSGKVELWPLITADKEQEVFWPLPQDYDNSLSPKKRLAIQIAKYIKHQIDQKIILPSTNLPARPQDFMILVRKRDDFTIEIINQLKNFNVDVLGIDRILLNENLSVLDLVATAKFVLNPGDDLNLACLLRSPIINLMDEDLENLRSSSSASLWDVISSRKDEPNIAYAHDTLNTLIDLYKRTNDTDFFLSITQFMKFIEYDVINEFLYLVTNYTNSTGNSLQGFLYWFETNEVEIKRNLESSNKIRVMTTHAAKGLQAPVVILADTTGIPVNRSQFFWLNDKEVVGSMSMTNSPEILKDLKETESKKELQEYLRLLYVGLTRAEDHLIICGYANSATLPQHCWYALVQSSLRETKIENELDVIMNQVKDLCSSDKTLPAVQHDGFPVILNSFKDIKLSQPLPCAQNMRSPLNNQHSLQYGKIFHKILEDSAKAKDIDLLSTHPLIATMPEKLQEKIYISIKTLLVNKDFLELFNQDIKTEVNIGIMENNEIKISRIDLLVINQTQVTIIDYKSDVKPPMDNDLVPKSYIEQLRSYRHVIQKIYPQHNVICKILWLANSSFSSIH